MRTADELRQEFAAGNLQTASPPKVVTMCFDRIERDLTTARAAIEQHDPYGCNEALGHAQDLVCELAMMLQPDQWEHGGSLMALYDYVLRVLTAANTTKDAGLVGEAHRIVAALGEAFRTAAHRIADGGEPAGRQPAPADAARPPDDPASADAAGPARLSLRA